MASKATEEAYPGQIYAKIINEAEKIMRQFNTPVASVDLLNKIMERELMEYYHQMTNIQRLQLEMLFGMIHSVDENACCGWQPKVTWTSTVVTVGTYGARTFTYDRKEQLAAQLVSNEGIASLKADFDLILKLVTKLTELPTPKKTQ
ncbi:hypothetical protein QR685DRAFT_589073 [Neurospora intermedia]|uniref:Uncharacterized protein n=1 Tax=Neurospora intermedia TaxID=5142 RepID=A0ABR3DCT0_NEUIN